LLEGYDHREIGEIMGISESTSKSQYNRAKKNALILKFNPKWEFLNKMVGLVDDKYL
jgi:transposase